MKKAWIFLIAMALLAFSMPVFADMAPAAGSFHAWNQGNLFLYWQQGSASATWGWGPQWDVVPGGPDQEWTFSYDGNNYGFNATFEFAADAFGSGTGIPAAISWFATYYKFGDLVKVTIGKPRFNDYTEFSQIEGNNYKRFGDSDWMAIAQLFPTPGASVAAAFYVPSVYAYGNTQAPDYAKNFGIAGSYAIPNMVSIKAMYRVNEATEVLPGIFTYNTSTPQSLFSVGVNYSGMKGLTANADLQANLTSSSNTVINAFVSASTTLIEPVTLAVDIALKNSSSPSQTAYAFEVDVQYVVMAPWTIGVTAGYDGGSATGVVTNWFNQGVGDWTGIEVWPYLKANFDNGSSFKIGVVYGSQDKAGASNAIIAVPIYYVWSF